MADSGGRQYQKLPPGWDCKYDQATGNCYYINYITKAMQLHDPRYRPLQNERCSTESIAMQSLHGPGGSPYHVYPSNNMPAMRAFQTPNSSLHHMSTSPLLTSSRTHLINESSPLPVTKSQLPQAPRTVNMSRRSTIQETSFSNQIDTDAVVHKIQNMFPTASENHIRLLLKKYYNREAVVISALQVEKHPVTMPGPYVNPPGQRHLFHSNSAIHMTPPARRIDGSNMRVLDMGNCYSSTNSPVPPGRLGSVMSVNSGGQIGPLVLPSFHGSPGLSDQIRSSPKPHSSPKMKLRYMKTVFPKADETLLLDVLANADNNVQKASEKIISLGYIKKEVVVPPRVVHRPLDERDIEQMRCGVEQVQIIPLRPKEYTEDEKDGIKKRLQRKYPHIVDHILLMALDSVNYDEDRAMQILQIVNDEEEKRTKNEIPSHGISGIAAERTVEASDAVDNISGGRMERPPTAIPTNSVAVTSAGNDKPESIGNNETDVITAHDGDFLTATSLSLNLNLSSVTMSTQSILDRYRSTANNNVSYYLRGTCSSTAFWDKLSPRSRDKSDSLKHSHRDCGDISTDKLCKDFQSLMVRTQCKGPNYNLAKGANESLLLADYVTWNGANPEFYQGQRNLALGPDNSIRSESSYKACGHNPDLCKGPQANLAKGSIYRQQNAATTKTINIKCN